MTVLTGGRKGNVAYVNNKGQLTISGVADPNTVDASIEGRGFFSSTGIVTLTSATVSSLLYIKNNSTRDLVIHQARHYLGVSTGGVGDFQTETQVNPTSGTLITGTDGVDYNTSTAVNTNLGEQDKNPFEGVVRVGLEGTTAVSTLGALPQIFPSGPHTDKFTTVLPRGAVIVFGIKPPTSNTSCKVVLDLLMYFKDEEER